jgi:hypothetical protein
MRRSTLAPLWPRRSDPMLLASVKRGREETLAFTRNCSTLTPAAWPRRAATARSASCG